MMKLTAFFRVAATACCLLAVPALVGQGPVDLGGRAFAQEGNEEAQRNPNYQGGQQRTRRTPAMSQDVFEKLSEAQEAIDNKQYAEARNTLEQMRRNPDKYNSYELAQMWNYYAYLYYAQEQFPQAVNAYQQILRQEGLPEGLEVSTLYSLAQLYFVLEDYDKAIDTMNRWFTKSPIAGAGAYALLGQMHYANNNMSKALELIQRAVNMREQKGKLGKENWYAILRAIYFDRGDYRKTTEILELMVKNWPKRSYYSQLSGMYGQLERDQDQLTMLDSLYLQGLLSKESELRNLAYLWMGAGVPYKAATIMEKGIKEDKIEATSKNLEFLANALRQSQEHERSLPYMESAARLSDEGDLYYRLSAIYLDTEAYDKAETAARRALQKGGLKNPSQARIFLGTAQFNLDKFDAAEKTFQQVIRDGDDDIKQIGRQWLRYIKAERNRRQQLQQS